MFRFLILILILTLITTIHGLTKVSIYYESLCPDSISFIKHQLYPNYAALKDGIELDFVPYGKATQTRDGENGWRFRCQHGRDECRGNAYQACALSQKKGQDKNVEFVHCAMSLNDNSDPEEIKECAEKTGFDFDKIEDCYKNGKGDDYLAEYGDRTHSVSPKIRFIPTIILNDAFNQETQNNILYDFLGTTCKHLRSSDRPKSCNHY